MQEGALYYARGNHPCAVFSSRMTLVLCTLLMWVAAATCRRRWTRFTKWMMLLSKEGLREDLQVSELKGVVLLPNIVNIRLEMKKSQKPPLWQGQEPECCLVVTRDSKREKQKERQKQAMRTLRIFSKHATSTQEQSIKPCCLFCRRLHWYPDWSTYSPL